MEAESLMDNQDFTQPLFAAGHEDVDTMSSDTFSPTSNARPLLVLADKCKKE